MRPCGSVVSGSVLNQRRRVRRGNFICHVGLRWQLRVPLAFPEVAAESCFRVPLASPEVAAGSCFAASAVADIAVVVGGVGVGVG